MARMRLRVARIIFMGAKHCVREACAGVWGDKFPPRRPRVSGARKRLLRTRAKRESVASYSKARGFASRNLTRSMVRRFEFFS